MQGAWINTQFKDRSEYLSTTKFTYKHGDREACFGGWMGSEGEATYLEGEKRRKVEVEACRGGDSEDRDGWL